MDVVFGPGPAFSACHTHPVHEEYACGRGRAGTFVRTDDRAVAAARVPSSSRGRYAFEMVVSGRARDHRGGAAAARREGTHVRVSLTSAAGGVRERSEWVTRTIGRRASSTG